MVFFKRSFCLGSFSAGAPIRPRPRAPIGLRAPSANRSPNPDFDSRFFLVKVLCFGVYVVIIVVLNGVVNAVVVVVVMGALLVVDEF